MNTDEPLPTRASLLSRLRNPCDDASWEEFHRTYRGMLTGVARRAGLNEHEAEEAVQDTLIAVAKKMPEFRYEPGQDSFKGWLLKFVRWKIVDQVRKRRRSGAAPNEDPPSVAERLSAALGSEEDAAFAPDEAADPRQDFDRIWDAQWQRHLLDQALARVKRQARPEHYAIYHLHVIEGLSPRDTARALGVSVAQVYLAKLRVGRLLKAEVARAERLEEGTV